MWSVCFLRLSFLLPLLIVCGIPWSCFYWLYRERSPFCFFCLSSCRKRTCWSVTPIKKRLTRLNNGDKVKKTRAMEFSLVYRLFFIWFHDGTGLTRGGRNSTRQWLVFWIHRHIQHTCTRVQGRACLCLCTYFVIVVVVVGVEVVVVVGWWRRKDDDPRLARWPTDWTELPAWPTDWLNDWRYERGCPVAGVAAPTVAFQVPSVRRVRRSVVQAWIYP